MTILKEYKAIIKHQIQTESELVDLLKECFVRIYGEENGRRANWMLEEQLEYGVEIDGCLQSLQYYDNHLKPKQ